MAETNGQDNIWFRGYGPGSSVLNYANGITTNQVVNVQICIEAGSKNILVSDLGFITTTACTTNCAPNTYTYIWRVLGNTENVWFEDNDFDIDQAVTTDATAANTFAIELNGDPDYNPPNVPRNVSITRNVFHGTDSGSLHAVTFERLIVSENFFDFRNLSQDPNAASKSNMRAIGVASGEGFVFSNNVVDFAINNITDPHYGYGVIGFLGQDSPTPASRRVAKGFVITGNLFKNMRTAYHTAIALGGVNNSVISGNNFSAGQCNANALYSCANARDCAVLGGAESSWTCNPSNVNGVYLETSSLPASMNANQGNLIYGNVFRGFQDTSGRCPLRIDAGGADANSNLYNLFANNLMSLDDSTQDGICGDATKIAGNTITNNTVQGASICQVTNSVDCPANSTAGQKLNLREDSDLGVSTWAIDVAATNLSGNFSITPGTNGKLDASALLTDSTLTTTQILDGTIDGEDMNASYAGRSLTETAGSPDVLDTDAELYTQGYTFWLKAPATTDDFLFVKVPTTATPTSFDCVANGGTLTTIDITIHECNSNGASCATIGAVNTVTVVDTDTPDTSFTDTTLTAGNWLRAVVGTVTWTSPGFITCTLKVTVDD
jgi:hypothetical protein